MNLSVKNSVQIYTVQHEQDDTAGNGQITPALSIYVCLGYPCSYQTVTYVTHSFAYQHNEGTNLRTPR